MPERPSSAPLAGKPVDSGLPRAKKSVYVLATLDTKGHEAAYVRDVLSACGVPVRLVDVGCLGEPAVPADVERDALFAAGGHDARELRDAQDRGRAVTAAAESAAAFICQAHQRQQLAGVLAIGGSAGTTIGTAAMRALPIGVPKVMLSTLASGQVRHYVGDKDVVMLNSVVDIAGLNRVTRTVLREAALAMAGMTHFHETGGSIADPHDAESRPTIAATMFGVTTPCIEAAREELESRGYEVLVFHATGNGGQAMESLIDDGLIAGVLDMTTTEIADELVGGVLSAGPQRLTAAARRGVPQVVSLGATDMVNFHAPDTVANRFAGRTFYQHNPNVTLMRTTAAECAAIGRDIGTKLAQSIGPVTVLAPMRGVSAIDREGQPFDDPAARAALVEALCEAGPSLDVRRMDLHLNDPTFAQAAVSRLLEMIEARNAERA